MDAEGTGTLRTHSGAPRGEVQVTRGRGCLAAADCETRPPRYARSQSAVGAEAQAFPLRPDARGLRAAAEDPGVRLRDGRRAVHREQPDLHRPRPPLLPGR